MDVSASDGSEVLHQRHLSPNSLVSGEKSPTSPTTRYLQRLQERDAGDVRTRRRSIRNRTLRDSGQLVEHNVELPLESPTSPVKMQGPSTQPPRPPQLQSRPSKISLFNLFSKPKVEKARGYAETGLAPPTPSFFGNKTANSSTVQLTVKVGGDPAEEAPRIASSLGFLRPASRAGHRQDPAIPAAPPHAQSLPPVGTGGFPPPPLFQAIPQAARHGTVEVGTVSSEHVLTKNKNKKPGLLLDTTGPRGSTEDGASIDTKRNVRSTLRHVANGSITQVDLPKRVVVLSTLGYLLQYAESGPSDRLPERVLQLGKESAAFACDLIPGKHYVLQISQAVDQQGVVVANTGGIFAKLGWRSAAAKRLTSNFLLVLPDAAAMDSWMTAIREEIEALGGQKARADTAVRPKTRGGSRDEMAGLKKVPSRTLRHEAQRSRGNSLVGKPVAEAKEPLEPPPRIKDDDAKSVNTIDGIEEEAEQIAEESRKSESPKAKQEELETQSVRSSMAPSIDQQRLNSLRSSVRMSHSTVATTVGSSRANSLVGSPPSDLPAKENSEAQGETTQLRSPYRTLASYATGIGRRRSAMPVAPNLDVTSPTNRFSTLPPSMESPVTGRNSPLPALPLSPRGLAVAASEPNLRAAADAKAKHDSKLPSPPVLAEESERPLSVVGDLPSPFALGADRSPNKRISLIQAATAQANAQRASMMRQNPRGLDMVKPPKRQSQPFSLPLRINPSTKDNRPPPREEQRSSFNRVEEGRGEPVVHTLTAKIDCQASSPQPSRTPSGRLSLFPTTGPSPSVATPSPPTSSDTLRRSPSESVINQNQQAQASGRALKRPTSMQVRSDHAPFLNNMRPSGPLPQRMPPNGRAMTAPIRSLKPSRSSTAISSKAHLGQPSPTDPFTVNSATFDIPTLPEEDGDKAMPLRAMSPLPSRPSSRAGTRKVKTRSSLPELDLGIPVVGLGPPAPPPQAPLPAPPPASRPTSPMPGTAGLGIRVS